jgi:putative CocE/NonD family hydrolase
MFAPTRSSNHHTTARARALALAPVAALAFACGAFAGCASDDPRPEADTTLPVNTARYLTMHDGTRIAVDVWLPPAATAGGRVPTVVRATRYSRDQEVLDRAAKAETNSEAEARAFMAGGYAEVIVDARGSGASFGTRPQPWSAAEVADYREIVDWIAAQRWSNGRIAAYGTSYDSNTAEMMASAGQRAVRAVVPRFGFHDVYDDVVFPGGIFNQGFVTTWLTRNLAIDRNDACGFLGATGPACDEINAVVRMAKPVDADRDRSLRDAAVAEHAGSPDQIAAVSRLVSADDRWNGADFASLSPGPRRAALEANQTAVMAWASWMDVASARAALNRWKTTDVPMVVYLGPWNHGADLDASPYAPADAPLAIPVAEQHALTLAFLDQHLTDGPAAPAARKIVYFTMGEEARKETTTWPPAGTVTTALYFREGHALAPVPAPRDEAPDRYQVDFTASTGEQNGWWTKLFSGDVVYGDRQAEDRKLLVYDTPPLDADTEITGHPTVTLYLSSSQTDGALFVYLEDVAPDGEVTYVTEGQLRLLHRKHRPCGPRDPYGPCRSFRSEDAQPMPVDTVQEVVVGLSPTSVLVKRGHAIRIAVAGQDASTFARVPAEGTPVLTVAHGPAHPSRVDLPVVARPPVR